MSKDPAAAASEFLLAYTDHAVERMVALCTDQAQVEYVPLGEDGRGSVRDTAVPLWRGFIASFEGFRVEVETTWVDVRRRTAIVATTNRGIHRVAFAGIEAAGAEIAVPHVFIIATEQGGLIEKITAYWDNDTFLRQLRGPSA